MKSRRPVNSTVVRLTFMKKPALILLAFVVAAVAQTKPDVPHFTTDDWGYVDASDAMRFFFSKTRPTQTGKTIRAWERVELRLDTVEGQKEQRRISNMTTPAWEGKNVNVASYNLQVEYDCAKNQFRERRYIFYDANGGVIEALPDYDGYKWKPVNPKSIQDVLKIYACENRLPPARPLMAATHNKSLDRSGGSVFCNLNGAAEDALIRAAALTPPLGCFSP
jgi:hypothetical protein